MKRLRDRPKLDPEKAISKSVYFRKPGDESVVGSGTYGKVFKGLNVYTKNLVALKKIRMEGEKDGFPVTAVREVKLLQSLRHENIVTLEEVMVEKNDCFMVFEYLSHDLTGILNHPSFRLNLGQKKHMAMQVYQGLDYLHKRGVLHRDIKAANILVSSDGILKLADFGLARFYAKRHRLDYTNRVITIWYRSPELLLGETLYGASVDVWSAACVMVEIFTSRAIFPGDGTECSQLEKIYNVLGTPNLTDWPGLKDMAWFPLLKPTHRKKSAFVEKYRDKIPGSAFELIEHMFQYDPARRPTASEVLAHPYFATEEPRPEQAVEYVLSFFSACRDALLTLTTGCRISKATGTSWNRKPCGRRMQKISSVSNARRRRKKKRTRSGHSMLLKPVARGIQRIERRSASISAKERNKVRRKGYGLGIMRQVDYQRHMVYFIHLQRFFGIWVGVLRGFFS